MLQLLLLLAAVWRWMKQLRAYSTCSQQRAASRTSLLTAQMLQQWQCCATAAVVLVTAHLPSCRLPSARLPLLLLQQQRLVRGC